MLVKRSNAIGLASALIAFASFCPCYSATTGTEAPLTLEEVKAKRQSVREDLMVPSLQGIRGLAYVVVVPDDSGESLDKVVGEKLKQLNIPMSPMRSMTPGFKPVDAILEFKVHKDSQGNSYVHLNVTQWCSLIRSPKLEVRAVTYSDSLSATPATLKAAVGELTSQFIINFLKANKQ